MGPRPPESREHFLARLREQAAAGADEIRFGTPHLTHAACRESDGWRVRRLVVSQADAEAYRKEHGYFMPESADQISKPANVVVEAQTLDDLVAQLGEGPWPL